MNTFSEQQIDAIGKIIKGCVESKTISWYVLLAQMQSGKTDVFLAIACELLELKIVDEVRIFSGNSETGLRDQLESDIRSDSDYWSKYKNFKRSSLTNEFSKGLLSAIDLVQQFNELDNKVKYFKSKIWLIWGCDLLKYTGPTKKTLFIWEEAHYAQNLGQRPAKFLKKVGISANGCDYHLRRNENLMLSVSATPFSELCNIHHGNQPKTVVKMFPGENYVSVERLLNENRICGYSDLTSGLNEALNKFPQYERFWWAIVRVSAKNQKEVQTIIKNNGWNYVVYDSVENNLDGEESWNKLNGCPSSKNRPEVLPQAPTENTVIIIKEMCRMGKRLHKEHLLFVFETSKNSKTDTILQSLLGRACGYDSFGQVIVYLSNKIKNNGEIESYIRLWNSSDDVNEVPKRANNLSEKRVQIHDSIIPIRVKRDLTRFKTNNNSDIIKNVLYVFQHENAIDIHDKNPINVSDKVKEKILSDSCRFKVAYLQTNKKTRNENLARNILEAYDHNIAKEFGSGQGIDTDGLGIGIWVPKNIPGFDNNYIYVTARVEKDIMPSLFPTTTGLEVFAHTLEDGTQFTGNGCFMKVLSEETSFNIGNMLEDIREFVGISLSGKGWLRKISSCFDLESKEFKGILVKDNVYKSLCVGGSIYNKIKNEFGVEIKIIKSKVKLENEHKNLGFTKLSSISW